MSKNKTYFQMLKEAVSGSVSTGQSLNENRYDGDYYKGPMIDPILSYDGSGGIETKKDAASILERFYFEEDEDMGIDTGADLKKDDEKEDKKDEEKLEEALDLEGGDLTTAAGDDEQLDDTLIPAPTLSPDKKKADEEKGVEQGNSQITTESLVIEKLIREMEEALELEGGDETEPAGEPEKQGRVSKVLGESEDEDEDKEDEDDAKEDLDEGNDAEPPSEDEGADEGDKDLDEAFNILIDQLKK